MASTKSKVRSSSDQTASSDRTAELETLMKAFRAAQAAGNKSDAIRLIDRARRIAPKNLELSQLYSLMLISEGRLDQASVVLDTLVSENPDPDLEAIYISALYNSGLHNQARARLEKALSQYAVSHDGRLARMAGAIMSEAGSGYTGWIAFAPDLTIHGEMRGVDKPIRLRIATVTSLICEHVIALDAESKTKAFAFSMPAMPAGGRMTATTDGGDLIGRNMSFPLDFGFDGGTPAFKKGRMLSFGKAISGWARLSWDPSRELDLSVRDERGIVESLRTHPDPVDRGRRNFVLKPDRSPKGPTMLTVQATMPDGTIRDLPGSPILLDVPPAPMPPAHTSSVPNREGGRGIDIVIPVYSGLTETLNCIRSVRETVDEDVNIIVVDDATPDTRLAGVLDALAAAKAITLLRNPRNLGFPESVNRGMHLNLERDAIILNADTEVFSDWIGRLRAAAYSAPDIGTATPLTNSGSIASYPDSGMFEVDYKTAMAIDQLAQSVNRNITIDLPTGVGFCLFIRRDCLRAVGDLDSETFGKGYGEETDFCMRASNLGWRHVLAADVYVRHVGGRSFGSRKNALHERNLRLMFLRHPAYHPLVDAFGKRDPAHNARRRLDEARLRKIGPSALIVSLALDGGVRRAAEERAASLKSSGLTPITLKPIKNRKGGWALTVAKNDFEDLRYDLNDDLDGFLSLLRALDLDHAELHHFLDLPPALIEGVFNLSCPIDIYIHDYIWYCPRINLLDGNDRYCGEPPVAACEICIKQNGSDLNESIRVANLRARSQRWLAAARWRIVPTPSVAARMMAQFPQLTFEVASLETQPFVATPIAPVSGRRIKVATIGAIGDHKGYKRLLEMARHAAENDLPLDFIVIGYTRDDRTLFDTGRIFVTGEYKEDEIEALIAREAPDLALFLSEFPETWCYSLTHALRAAIPAAALDLGALGDRLRNLSDSPLLFPLSSTAAELCALIIAAFARPAWNYNLAGGHNIRNEASGQRDKHGKVMDIPPPPNRGEILRKNMATQLDPQPANVNFIPLTQGLFLFSVRSTQPPVLVDSQNGVALPAMHLSPAPAASGQIEFVSAPNTASAWLSYPHDRIVVRVTAPSAVMLLSSIAGPDMTPIEIEIQRLDVDAPETAGNQGIALPAVPATQASIGLKVTAHIQNRGDLEFTQSQWANADGERFWIESFSILPLAVLSPDQIEYQALTATGVQTPWISNGASCGTRGIGVPLTGFAVRLKADAGALGTCEYGAVLMSGTLIGPISNGAMCQSQDAQDPIVGLWVSINVKAVKKSSTAKAKATRPQNLEKSAAIAQATTEAANPETEKHNRSVVGPRFSIFRDSGKSK